MKIAVLICGLPRSYKKTYESFHVGFKDYDADVYIHSWKTTHKSVNNASNSKNIDSNLATEQELQNLFSAKKVVVEEQVATEIPGLILPSTDPYPNNAVCFHESIKRCFKLIDNPNVYDVFVITRPDIYYYERLPLKKQPPKNISVPYINNLYEGKDILKKGKRQHPDSFFDMLYNGLVFGSYEEMLTFASFADDYVDICKQPKYYLSKEISYIPDRALAIYIKQEKNITVNEFRYRHGIMRDKQVQQYSW